MIRRLPPCHRIFLVSENEIYLVKCLEEIPVQVLISRGFDRKQNVCPKDMHFLVEMAGIEYNPHVGTRVQQKEHLL